jgi:hypothetical protein
MGTSEFRITILNSLTREDILGTFNQIHFHNETDLYPQTYVQMLEYLRWQPIVSVHVVDPDTREKEQFLCWYHHAYRHMKIRTPGVDLPTEWSLRLGLLENEPEFEASSDLVDWIHEQLDLTLFRTL